MVRWHRVVEWFLPWYDSARERQREARMERIVRRGELARLRSQRVIARYRDAAKVSHKAGLDEINRDDR